ncbi:MAG TPA: HYD1 signature containing ADP-ribosyltransferase family protein [Gemmataceae bacterium]|nr:HYD1 signature containing ADP-ribosyltransferase family protein [Gemmataceae bacterium]
MEPTTIRLRHYTRVSSKERILAEGQLLARDQNKVFVERADHKPLSTREAEARYLLKRGKGNAYVEFDARVDEVSEQTNRLTGEIELFLPGDVDLAGRNPQGFDNR